MTAAPPLAATDIDQPSRRLWWAMFGVVCALLLLPLPLVDVPPLLDYPNHLARLFVLAHPDDPVLSAMYQRHWSIIPNLAIDVLAPPLLRILPPHVAGRLVLAVALVLPVVGCMAYSRAAFGRRSLWPLASGLLAYNALFILGFVNFQVALGVAFLAGAVWQRWSDRRPVLACGATAAAAVPLFFCHLFGVLLLGVLLGAREATLLWRVWRDGGHVIRVAAWRGVLLGGVFVVPVALYFMAPLHEAGGALWLFSWPRKLLWLFDAVADTRLSVWLISAVVVASVPLVLAGTGRLRAARGAGLAAAILLVGYFAAPIDASNTAFIDARLPVMLALLLFAGFAPAGLPRRTVWTVGAVLGALLLLRTATTAELWLDHNADVAALREVIAPVEPGARVLVTTVEFPSNPGYWASAPLGRMLPSFVPIDIHMAALLLIERRAFWPFLFAVATKQPLSVRPPYDRIALPYGRVPDIALLADPSAVPKAGDLSYLAHWWSDFDYVLLLNPDAAGDLTRLVPGRMTLISGNDMAALFRVRRPGG